MMPENLIRLSKSVIGPEEKNAVIKVLDNGRLGMGSEVKKFEDLLSKFFDRPALCCVNGTAALHLSLQASGVGFNDEVLVQSLTYLATFQAISACGAKPVPCDVNKDTLTLDLNDASKKLTNRTKAVVPVHFAGDPGKLHEIYEFASSNGLRVIEDSAHAFGTKYNNQTIGSFGDISCFSFDGIKNITSGEGGCIVSDDMELIRLIKDARLLGIINDTNNRFSGKRSWNFDVSTQGWRYHMSDIMAAIGIQQLNKIDYFSRKRQDLAKKYDELLSFSNQISSFKRNYTSIVPHIYSIILPKTTKRDLLREKLYSLGIETGIHYLPNHKLSYYQNPRLGNLLNTEEIAPRLLSLPLHPDLNEEDLEFVVRSLIENL